MQFVYVLIIWIGVMCALFTLMTIRQVLAHFRKRRAPETLQDRSVTPILRFNLRKHFVREIKAGAAHSLENMEPGGLAYRLREVLLNHDASNRAALEVLEHIEARSRAKNARRGTGAESKRSMRI